MQNVDYKQKYEKYKLRYLEAKKFLQTAGEKPIINNKPTVDNVVKQIEKMKQSSQIEQMEATLKNKIMEMFGQISNKIVQGNIADQLQNIVKAQKGGAYSEESRGFNSDKVEDKDYPPCFRICGASRAMHDDLKELGLLDKYQDLIVGLNCLGLDDIKSSQVEVALKKCFPSGTDNIEEGEVLKQVYCIIKEQNSTDNVSG